MHEHESSILIIVSMFLLNYLLIFPCNLHTKNDCVQCIPKQPIERNMFFLFNKKKTK